MTSERGVADLWIFGYGSLMWRPDIPFVERHVASVTGFHRGFCVASTHHRGTEARPGLVLGLDRGGSCTGIAYRIPDATRQATIEYLRERELIYGVYRTARIRVQLHDEGHRQVSALAYIVERAHPSYAGRLSAAEQVRRIRQAQGISGANLDYLINTVNQLTALGIRERGLERLVTLAAGPAKRGAVTETVRPAVRAIRAAWARHPVTARPLTRDQRRRFCYRWRIGSEGH
ncbi:MAG: gamma-glutamylcyclotransferase [Hyphomicrobiaceae bacterium]